VELGGTYVTHVLPADIATNAQWGEGVIRITTRVCGNADNWEQVAAANGISPPVYLVLLDQRIVVSCAAGSSPKTPASAPAAAPPAPAPAPQAASSGWANPVCAMSIGDGLGAGRNHMGVDLIADYGTPIRAAAAGTVSVATQIYYDEQGRVKGAGNYTTISHGNNVWTQYFHQSKWAVTSGWVATGQIIGYVGSTGDSSGPHLHFEVRTGSAWGYAQDPIAWMNNHGVRLGC